MMTKSDRTPSDLPADTLTPRDTGRSLPIALLRSREAVMARFRPVLAAHGVTEQQWRVLRVLGETSPLDASEVAERACVLAPSLTRIIRALEERGLIHKLRDEVDGRRVLLSLSDDGAGLIREVMPESRAVYADLEARFGAQRMEQLLDLLAELAALK